MAKKNTNNFGEKKRTTGIKTISDTSQLKYRKSLDPLEQTDEDAVQERWGSGSQQKGVTTAPFSRGIHIFIDDFARQQGALKAGIDGSLSVAWNATGEGVDVPSTLLNGGINSTDTTITVDSTERFISTDVDGMLDYTRLIVDSEIIYYTGKTLTTFTGCTRGMEGTSAASHSNNAPIYLAPGVLQMGTVMVKFDPTGPAIQPMPGYESLVDIGAANNRFETIYADVFSGITAAFQQYTMRSGAGDPTTSNYGTNGFGLWKNTTSGEIRMWVNDGGTMKKSAAFT